jgi:hypothetical protein
LALVNVTHKPIPGKARQFDGTLDSFLDIINARPKANLVATCTFNAAGAFVGLQVSGGGIGGSVSVGVGDWVVFPDDTTEPVRALNNGDATDYWQVV